MVKNKTKMNLMAGIFFLMGFSFFFTQSTWPLTILASSYFVISIKITWGLN